MERSEKPFPQVLKDLLNEQDVSQRELTRRCQRYGWGSLTAVGHIARGKLPPTLRAMETIGRALNVPPETFAEYRIDSVRHRLNHREVGLRKALRYLDELEGR